MKVIQFIYSLGSGGAERLVVELSNRIAAKNNDKIVVMTLCDSKEPTNVHYIQDLSPEVEFVNLHCKRGLSFMSFWRVFFALKKEKADILHIHCGLLLFYAPLFILPRFRCIHTLHSLAPKCLQFNWCKPINKWLYKHRVQPICISRECMISYVNLYGLDNAICVLNGREPLHPSQHMPTDLKYLLKEIEPVVIHVAHISPAKNHARLFRTFERLYNENFKFQLIVIGKGFDIMWPQFSKHPCIHFLGEKKNVEDYLSFSDFIVLSSDYEGLPISLLEAMSLGVVPISTPAGGVVDVVKDGQNGYVSDKIDDESFYLKVKQALMEKGKISPQVIIKDFEEHYTMERCSNDYYNIYMRILHIN